MAFTATKDDFRTRPVWGGGMREVKWTFTNEAGDTGGTIDTGLAFIGDVDTTITSHVDAFVPKITIAEPNVTIVVGDGVDGTVTVKGRGFV